MEFKFDEPVKNCKTCGYCNNSVCKLGDDDPNRFCIEYHRWKPKEPEKSCDNCGNGPKMSAKCTITTCHESNDRPEPGYFENWKPKKRESTMKVTAEAYKLLKESIDVWKKYLRSVVSIFGRVNNIDRENCPLCIKYNCSNKMGACVGCPIARKTIKENCAKTPYPKASSFEGEKVTGETIVSIEKEIDFLSELYDECVVEEEEKTYSIGDKFEGTHGYYELNANADGKVIMSNLECGSHNNGAWKVDNSTRITKDEFKHIAYPPEDFHPVTLSITKVENK